MSIFLKHFFTCFRRDFLCSDTRAARFLLGLVLFSWGVAALVSGMPLMDPHYIKMFELMPPESWASLSIIFGILGVWFSSSVSKLFFFNNKLKSFLFFITNISTSFILNYAAVCIMFAGTLTPHLTGVVAISWFSLWILFRHSNPLTRD